MSIHRPRSSVFATVATTATRLDAAVSVVLLALSGAPSTVRPRLSFPRQVVPQG